MIRKMGIAVAAFALSAASASTASAQNVYETEMGPRTAVRAPSRAFEAHVGTGYAQGFGPAIGGGTGGAKGAALGGPGIGADLGLGYRINPHVSIGGTAGYNELNMAGTNRGVGMRGATAGFEATYHAAPYSRVDPWFSVGGGYRLLWTHEPISNTNTYMHGFELGRLNLGVDVRVNDSIAVAPTIGGDLNMFVWRKPENAPIARIETMRVNPFLFAGVSGRFDIGGDRMVRAPASVVGRR